MLICRESLLCGGRVAEREPRSGRLMYLWTQKEAKGASRHPPPVSAHAEPHDLTGDASCVGPGHSPFGNGWLPELLCPLQKGCFPSFSPVMEVLFHRGHHQENAVGSRARAQDPSNLTHGMSENITQSKE